MSTLKRAIVTTIFVLFAFSATLFAQGVIVTLSEDLSRITIQNNRSEVIYIFKKDIPPTRSGNIKELDDGAVITNDVEIYAFDCLDTRKSYIKIQPGKRGTFNVKKCNVSKLYYYPCSRNVIRKYVTAKITMPVVRENIKPLAPASQPKTPVAQPKAPVRPGDTVSLSEEPEVRVINLTEDEPIQRSEQKPATKNVARSVPQKSPEKTQEEVFNEIRNDFLAIDAKSRVLLNKGKYMQETDKTKLAQNQKELNSLKRKIDAIIPINDSHEKIKSSIVSRITFLIGHISEATIADSKTIKEDYKDIYDKYTSQIASLEHHVAEIEVDVNRKVNEFSLIRWWNKEPVYELIQGRNKELFNSEKEFNADWEQFVSRWKKEDREKLENLLIKQNDDIRGGYNKLKYNMSLYEKRLEELTPPYGILALLVVVGIFIIVALIFYIREFWRNRKLKARESEMMENSIRSVDEDEEIDERIYYESGLDEVRDYAEEYYVINMNAIYEDTAIEKVYLSRNCILDIYRFFMEFLKQNSKTNETGCFVIGRWEEVTPQSYNISLEEIIEPGNDAVYGEYEMDFGTQIGIGLEGAIIDKQQTTNKDYVQTCWIHSHPGLGLFLSNHDLIVQSQLVYSEHPTRMLAIVIDSNTEDLDTAFFTPKKSGEMNNKDDMKKVLSFEKICRWAKGMQVEPEPEPEPEPQEPANIIPPEYFDFNTADYYAYTHAALDAGINSFLFSGAAIIDMDSLVSPRGEGLKGYFYGRPLYKYQARESQRQILIDTFRTAKSEEYGEPAGCLLVLPHFTYHAVLAKYEPIIDRYDFFIVYNPQQDDLIIISRSLNGKYLIVAERDLHPLQMMEMRKWTRRKRS